MSARATMASSWLGFTLLGWISPIVPFLVPTIERQFGRTDLDIGLLYLVQAAAFTVAAVASGFLTERFGRRAVLVGAFLAQAGGLAGLTVAGEWPAFVAGGAIRGLGAGAIEGGIQALVLDLVGNGSREMNLLHVTWSAGAFVAPIGVALIIGVGSPWQTPIALAAAVSLALAAAFAVLEMPSGRRTRTPHEPRLGIGLPLVALSAAIAVYVAAESGIAGWLGRFFVGAPLTVSSSALSLFWGGLTAGRLVSARFATRIDPLRVVALAATCGAIAVVAAVAAPAPYLSAACFGVAGFAAGPIFPMIIVAGARLAPGRAVAATGILSAAAVAGGIVYPPVMGSISTSLGIAPAMLGTAALAATCAALAVVTGLLPASGRTAGRVG